LLIIKTIGFPNIDYLIKPDRMGCLVNSQPIKSIAVLFLYFLVILFDQSIIAQSKTNVQNLHEFAEQKKIEWESAREEAERYALKNNLPIRKEFPDGTIIEIQKLQNGIPVYYITHNVDAAATTRTEKLYPGGGLGLNLTGSGYSALGEWDGGGVLTTHQEFGGRVTQGDSPLSTSDHSTHVAGTLVAAGTDADARGMAYQANLTTYDWNSDESEMASAAAAGMEISNHSYGIKTGWYGATEWWGSTSVNQNESYWFGFYDSDARDWDQIAYNAPYYLIVKSAGNDRNDTAPTAGTAHSHNGIGSYTDTHYDDGFDNGGFDCISSKGVAKNILTVGAVSDLLNYTFPSDVVAAEFSGWGPADDGRIKPDLVGNGIELYSCISASTTSYATSDGTSMSSPNVTGTLALLQQHYQNTHTGNSLLSATLKALVLHTADEAGPDDGPDYMFGWGLLNAERAAQKITEDGSQNVIDEQTLSNGGTYTRVVDVNSSEFRVTVVWTDPPGTPVSASLDPTDPMLVNDLDLRISGNSTTYYPWKLDVANPTSAATNNTENNVDNVEQIYIANPNSGSYTITVDHDGTLSNPQDFAIIISGIDEFSSVPLSCSSDLITPSDGETDVPLATTIEWEPVNDATSYDLYFGTDNPPTDIVNGTNQSANTYGPTLLANTTYYINVIPNNNQGANSGCSSTIWSFTTENQTIYSTYPVIEDFDGFSEPSGIGTGNEWENSTVDDFDWEVQSSRTPSDNTGPSSDHTSGSGRYLYTEASTPNYPDKWAILHSPLYDLSSLTNPTLEFWYHLWDGANSLGGVLYVDVYGNGNWYNVFH